MSSARDDYDRHRLEQLRKWRNRPQPDLSLGFLKKQFKREVEKPYKQLGDLAALWDELVPERLSKHTRLDGLNRGVLHVSVDASVHLYELSQLLRSGLERQLIQQHRGPAFRRVKLTVNPQSQFPGP
mgnify:CR=1 FL=1